MSCCLFFLSTHSRLKIATSRGCFREMLKMERESFWSCTAGRLVGSHSDLLRQIKKWGSKKKPVAAQQMRPFHSCNCHELEFFSTEYFAGRREVNQPGLKRCGSLPPRRLMARSIRSLISQFSPHGCTPGEVGSRGRPLKRVRTLSYSHPFIRFPLQKVCCRSST